MFLRPDSLTRLEAAPIMPTWYPHIATESRPEAARAIRTAMNSPHLHYAKRTTSDQGVIQQVVLQDIPLRTPRSTCFRLA